MPKTKDAQICVRMDSELKEMLQKIADQDDRSLAYIVIQACKEYCAEYIKNH